MNNLILLFFQLDLNFLNDKHCVILKAINVFLSLS